ncbi:MAG: carbamoyl-phosphate synthase subunit L, partial [Leptonema sp. (in: Bacteria)]|nr:carbamoyl-phosphate synthase subunit L [Leptonema sp. (in: bacteria)]
LYIWNDGAGANIKQGMVALNRAAEGFFFNALIGARLTPKQAYQQIENHTDPIVKKIVDETTKELNLESAFDVAPIQKSYSVAVGVGSSTGLDVYGSSQSAIQVMIDDEQSYRVLTGSAVIKSVTGEDLTNYEIGGARIMNRVTGTVDRVARSNLNLITLIHELHELFTNKEQLSSIRRNSKSNGISLDIDDVITPAIIEKNVDDSRYLQFKDEYYGSGVLTGGFARLAGHPTLIMGPRSKMGLRSFQSLTRACELLLTARKLSANQIIVVGDEWFSETPRTDVATLQTRKDFLKLMSEKVGLRIHIATTVNGLRHIMLHSVADALIFVKSTESSQKTLPHREQEIINNTATHIVNSLTEAFDLAVSIQSLLNCCTKSQPTHCSNLTPTLPADTAQPFDIIESIIQPVFDLNSFIEWWGPMNDKTHGPSLVTGFATINKRPVAIIADQPSILGGAPDALGTQKFRWFTELVERNQLPIIMLSNAPGFMPGTRQERLRIQQIGGRSLDVNVLSTVAVVSVVLQQNFGGRQIHAFSKFLRPNIQSVALSNSTLAVMGSSSAFDLFQGKNYQQLLNQGQTQEAQNLRNQFIADFQFKSRADQDAVSTGVLDQVIESVSELRPTIIDLLNQIPL